MKSNIQMPLVLDGAMGTELLKLGLKLPLPLWSAIANEEHYKKVVEIHKNYITAKKAGVKFLAYRCKISAKEIYIEKKINILDD